MLIANARSRMNPHDCNQQPLMTIMPFFYSLVIYVTCLNFDNLQNLELIEKKVNAVPRSRIGLGSIILFVHSEHVNLATM